jgi:hypothetical protein
MFSFAGRRTLVNTNSKTTGHSRVAFTTQHDVIDRERPMVFKLRHTNGRCDNDAERDIEYNCFKGHATPPRRTQSRAWFKAAKRRAN